MLAANASPEAVAATLAERFLPADRATLHFNALFVDTGRDKVLIDAGSAASMGPAAGKLAQNLLAAGVDCRPGRGAGAHHGPARGITYGERTFDPVTREPSDEPEGDVGLLFMAYDVDVANQFEFTQRLWVNNLEFLKPNTGLDPVLGQGASGSPDHHKDGSTAGATRRRSQRLTSTDT